MKKPILNGEADEEKFPPLDPPPQQDTQNVREITLTDRLNKQLLQSFLGRINETGCQVDLNREENGEDRNSDNDFS